ncbi:MAG TPA: ComEC/Rec2 family competence protein [Candidatus Paceibacterota bacterium]|nr:ComEC/Rec2 family competence protein [Candidatus Paceibacterota bacterium]
MEYRLAPGDWAFGIAAGFLLGVLAANLEWSIWWVAGAAVACGGFWFLIAKRHYVHEFRLFLFFLLTVFFGVFYFHLYLNVRSAGEQVVFGKQPFPFWGVVASEPKVSATYQSFTLSLKPPLGGSLFVLEPPLDSYSYGDALQLEGTIEPPRSPGKDPAIAFPRTKIVANGRGFWLKEKLLGLRSAILVEFQKYLPGDEAALLGGITLGSAGGMSAGLKNALSASGMSYVISMYGFKIAMIAFALMAALRGRLPRRTVFAIIACAILLFLLMSGGTATAIRAGIMASFALLAQASGRIYNSRNAMAFTAAGMALANPAVLVDIGFELSFASILGIIYLLPAIENALRMEKSRRGGLREIALISLAAQLPLVPIAVNAFGMFPFGSILASILIGPFLPLTMALGASLATTGAIFSYAGLIIAKCAGLVAAYEIAVIRFFADIPFAVGPSFGTRIVTIVYYGALAAFIFYFLPRTAVSKR